jgi:hypothetical protein
VSKRRRAHRTATATAGKSVRLSPQRHQRGVRLRAARMTLRVRMWSGCECEREESSDDCEQSAAAVAAVAPPADGQGGLERGGGVHGHFGGAAAAARSQRRRCHSGRPSLWRGLLLRPHAGATRREGRKRVRRRSTAVTATATAARRRSAVADRCEKKATSGRRSAAQQTNKQKVPKGKRDNSVDEQDKHEK